MPPKVPVAKASANQQSSKKRKEAPSNAGSNGPSKRPRFPNQTNKFRDARTLATQTSSKAFKHGELDVDKFVKSREYEIRALEQGLARSKKALTKRAFQQVPKELRRRTASHNVKKVPKRLRERGKREMKDDNTPTVTARRRKKSGLAWLRLETAGRLRELGKKGEKGKGEKVVVRPVGEVKPKDDDGAAPAGATGDAATIKTRVPKVKKATLATPSLPKAKFRKRQIHKSWLPTHLFHAKRARMTPPKEPLWRCAIPLTPTAKSYRPTHRAVSERGAVCWDVSYVSTISLLGKEASISGMLKALGVAEQACNKKCRDGQRVVEAKMHEREAPHRPVAPVMVIWCAPDLAEAEEKRKRQVLLRVHPSAFFQLWEEVLRLAAVTKPSVTVEDLRFELGSIEVIGPASTEAFLSALWPSQTEVDGSEQHGGSHASAFTQLAGLSNPAVLPKGAVLAFNIQDPRLHHPPRPVTIPTTPDAQIKLLEHVAAWPPDIQLSRASLFSRQARSAASSSLPSQKAINRRKTLATPGQYPDPLPKDPKIPVLLYTSPSPTKARNQQSSWTVLLPWKCVQPVWYSLMYTPLSTGQQPKFGGLDEQRQLALERGVPWFPGDFPGTKAGWEWEVQELARRKAEWKRRPKSKRTSWEAVDLGGGKKGEVGEGWACDWARLVAGPPQKTTTTTTNGDGDDGMNVDRPAGVEPAPKPTNDKSLLESPQLEIMPPSVSQISSSLAHNLLTSASLPLSLSENALFAVRVSILTRGLPTPCARIYRLPVDPELRRAWLLLHPYYQQSNKERRALPRLPRKELPEHVTQQRLAASLLEPPKAGMQDYPACPGEEDLVGFVTSGNYDLGSGRGIGIGSLLARKFVGSGDRGGEEKLCIVRNTGMGIGRLAVWEVA